MISEYLNEGLGNAAGRALAEVFLKQLKLELVPQNVFSDGANQVHATVAIIGERLKGSVLLQFPELFAAKVTEILIGCEGEPDDIKDVTGEICNMVAGRLKSDFAAAGFSGTLATPTVTVGTRINLHLASSFEHFEGMWACDGHSINLQIQIRTFQP
jgi:CheY-specific phosphatase CheX